ncbi:PIN domain-containing protein [Pseudochelatococcus sp. B33]
MLSDDPAKADVGEALLRMSPLISVQVLNEVTQVCARKLTMGWNEIGQFLGLVRSFCRVVALTEEVHDHARYIAKRYRLSFYDACIASAAIPADCGILYTEDMGHNRTLEGSLGIRNPLVRTKGVSPRLRCGMK